MRRTTITDKLRSRPRGSRCRSLPVISLLLLTMVAVARPQAVPESAQIPIFFRLLTYDRTLWEDTPSSLKIGVLHHVGDDGSHDNLVAVAGVLEASSDKTINGIPFTFETISWSQVAELPDLITAADIQVLYVTVGHSAYLREISTSTRNEGILTLAGGTGDVNEWLSVGLDLDGERPVIEVNLQALAAEQHQLDARILRLCTVVSR